MNSKPLIKLELLAPAKNLECGRAAVDHGADAVYIGAERFGARVAAGNTVDDIRQLCDYAHPFGVRVYVTVNTIAYDDELPDTERLIGQLCDAGVDAILVQDMGLLRLPLPPVALHASTQTDNRTSDKVRWLRDQGFRRVVLARELSAAEVRAIHEAVPDVELEVFVHGALCVSYSGQCYASQHCFGRSANRGACAQFCRMPFDLVDASGRVVEHNRHLLSLRDLNLSDHLLELAEAGATSFKIEGRLKDVNYVKNVTAAYSQRLDSIVSQHPDRYRRASLGRCTYTFTPDLRKTFNRGYTTYFLHGRQPAMGSFDTPKAVGEFVGTVKELRPDSFTVAGVASFANGDGLCFVDGERQLQGFRANRVAGNRIYPYRMPQGLRPGLRLYRNSDQDFERQLSRNPSAQRKIALRMELEAFDDDGFASGYGLKLVTDTVAQWVRIHAEHEFARQSQRERITAELRKLGGTPFECTEVVIPDDFPYFLPASKLAELRRFGISTLQEQLARTARDDTRGTLAPAAASAQSASAPPAYGVPYLYNVSNHLAAQFYREQGVETATAFELEPPRSSEALIMQCRYCLRHALGFCTRHGGQRPTWKEPLHLRLADGRCFPLEFDCRHCQMNVYGNGK